MSHNKYIRTVRIFLKDAFASSTSYGIYALSFVGDTTADSPTITNIPDTTGVVDGLYVRISAGFAQSPTGLYRVVSHTSTTITVANNAWSTESGVTVSQQSEIRWSEDPTSFGSGEVTAVTNWGGQILVTAMEHGLIEADEGSSIEISGTTIYDGIWLLVSVEDTNNFILNAVYTENYSGSATWENLDIQWKYGMIGGISASKESGDFRNGGCVTNHEGLSVDVQNGSQFLKYMESKGIVLDGCKAVVSEFVGEEWDSKSVETVNILTGEVDKVVSDEQKLSIEIKNTYYDRGEVNLSSIDTPKPVVTFGEFLPSINAFDPLISEALAKLVRRSDEIVRIYSNADFATGSQLYYEITHFPVVQLENDVDGVPSRVYFQIKGVSIYGPKGGGGILYDNTIMEVVDGDGKGQFVLVDSFDNGGPDNRVLCKIKTVFKEDLSASGDTRSWVRFFTVDRSYVLDSAWPCAGFIDKDGASIANNAELYLFENDLYTRFSDYSYEFSTVADKNEVLLRINNCSDDRDKVWNFLILPVKDLSLINSSTLNEWGQLGDYYYKLFNGAYINKATPPSGFLSSPGSGIEDPDHVYDKDGATYGQFNPSFYNPSATAVKIVKAYKFTTPDLPRGLDPEGFYLAANINIHCEEGGSSTNGKFFIEVYKWPGLAFQKTVDVVSRDMDALGLNRAAGYGIRSLPDYYYNPYLSTKDFFFLKDGTASAYYWFGYENMKINGLCKQNYDEFRTIGLFVQIPLTFDAWYHLRERFYELAILADLGTANVGKELWTSAKGRTYDDTWGGRRIAANIIDDPVDVIEHLCRLKNWGDNVGGLEYSDQALIKTSGAGSFDSTALNKIRDYSPAFQLFDSSRMIVNDLIRRFCETYGLCSRVDSDGYECLEAIWEPQDGCDELTFRDLKGPIEDIEGVDQEGVYCQPEMKYCYDYGKGEYTQVLKITKLENEFCDSSCYLGYGSESEGPAVWEYCKNLRRKYRKTGQPPADWVEQPFVRKYEDAVRLMWEKLFRMEKSKRLRVYFPYAIGRKWFVGKHIYLTVPDGYLFLYKKELVIEDIEKDKDGDLVTVKCINIRDFGYDRVQQLAVGNSADEEPQEMAVENSVDEEVQRIGGI